MAKNNGILITKFFKKTIRLIISLSFMHRYDECIEDCDRAIEIDNLAVKAYYRRMMANESLGNNMDALKDCTTVLTIEPKNSEAKRSLERINERLRKQSTSGPNFSAVRANLLDILPIDKPAYKRSTKPLRRIPIADVVGPKDSKNHENLKISDEDIDKLFNSNCGHFEEIKPTGAAKLNVEKETANLAKEDKSLENKCNKEVLKQSEEHKSATAGQLSDLQDTNKISATTTDIKEVKSFMKSYCLQKF